MNAIALILAAGRGSRMRSSLIKVLHPLLGIPMVMWPVRQARLAGLQACLVVGHQEDKVRSALADENLMFARQETPKGTGHAVLSSLDQLPAEGLLLVCCGDTPLLRAETFTKLIEAHQNNLATVLTAKIDQPASYGRIVRDDSGRVLRIVEAAEATEQERAIKEINTGAYVFDLAWLREQLPSFLPHPPKNEIYLTDAIERAAFAGRAGAVVIDDFDDCRGVNDRWALAQAASILHQRTLRERALSGVGFEDPSSNSIDVDVEISPNTFIERGAILRGTTQIAEGSRIGAYSVLENAVIGAHVTINAHSHLSGAIVEDRVTVGPFARLREGAILKEKSKIGNFVEIKKSTMGVGAKAGHLSYIGDSSVGEGVNIGAGTITCNYDGFQKHKTTIGEGAFIGSNTSLVAPVDIGAGAIIGAGSTITRSVSRNAIGVERSEQRNIEAAAERFRDKRKV